MALVSRRLPLVDKDRIERFNKPPSSTPTYKNIIKPSEKLLRNNPPPNSTPEQLKSWYKHIELMKEEKKKLSKGEQTWLTIKTIAYLAIAGYGIYLIFS